MEYLRRGSLSHILKKERNKQINVLDNTKKQILLIGIARGMLYLHNKKIVHRDIKPGNIMLDENYYPKIIDFGLSKKNDKEGSMSLSVPICGTEWYMSPEIIQCDDCHYTELTDVYSFGIIMFEIITG